MTPTDPIGMSGTDGRGRLEQILAIMAAGGGGAGPGRRLCSGAAEALHVGGVGVMVMADGIPAPLCASDPSAAGLEEWQRALGEGPNVDAYALDRPVSEPDLAGRPTRWVAFAPAALAAGTRAVFPFPVRVGGVRLGALTLYQTAPGRLRDDQHADAIRVAGVIANAILEMQMPARPQGLGPELEVLADAGAEVHQASGMLSVQLGVSVGEALVRLRAHAFAADRPLSEVAAAVVAHRLRLDE
jgi:hypothetical protein